MSNFISLPNPTRVFKSSTLPLPAPSCQYALRGSAARYPYHEKRSNAVPRLFFTKKDVMGILYASKHRRYRQHAYTPCARSFARGRFALCWTGLDWTCLVWLGSGPRIENLILAPLLAQSRMMCFIQVSYCRLKGQATSPDGGSLPTCNVPRSHQKDQPALCFHTGISDTALSGIHMQ